MADQISVRDRIISSVFSRRNAMGSLEETYVGHVKIWEDAGPEGGGRKPRYILLSQASNGSGFIHKSKLNTNGSFSVGKTWRLAELHGIQVLNPLAFNITISRTYRWQTESQADQANFINATIRLFRQITNNSVPLQLEGMQDPDAAPAPAPTTTPASRARELPVPRVRPPSPTQSIPSTLRPGRARRPSNANSTSSQVPSLNLPTPTTLRPHDLSTSPTPSQSPINGSLSARTPHEAPHTPSSAYPPSPHRSRPASPAVEPPRRNTPSPRPVIVTEPQPMRQINPRVSFYDPANQAMLDRLVADGEQDGDGEDETVQATLANVEEMLEGYEWASDDVIDRKTARGAADLIEARLLDELMALEKANIHSFLESDDRIDLVVKYMDDALTELDAMDSLLSSYKIHLNAVGDDISYIQSQGRGLQVQTQNQRALLGELENLVQTVQVDRQALLILTQESLEKPSSIERLEEAAAELYKALQAGRETDMAATMERLEEYRTYNSQFCKRVLGFLSIMFTAQSKLLLGDKNGISKPDRRGRPALLPHKSMEDYLGRYAGLMLYLKEMDEIMYGKLCGAYFSAASELHAEQMKALMSIYLGYVRKAPEEDQEITLGTSNTGGNIKASTGMRRAGTLIRSPLESRHRDKEKTADGDLRASEAFSFLLEEITPMIYRESDFITDFLQINDAALTFADYMGLDSYFRRQAGRSAGLSMGTMKLVRGAMDLIFGFLAGELKAWLDQALLKDHMQDSVPFTELFGVLACLERCRIDANERNNAFLSNLFDKAHMRLKASLDRHINDQIRSIEQTKLTSKKRRGVAPFVKQFPIYIRRVEQQLIGTDDLEIRSSVDDAYDKIVQAMFDSLKQMAKMDGEGEDKGQLNYHVILIENMHHFVAETSQMEIGSVNGFSRRAETMYDENLNAYVKIVLRRPFAKIIDYFEGIERLLKMTAPLDISSNSSFSKSALKKVVKEYTSKDIRKQIDALFKRVEKHFTEASDAKASVEETSGIPPGTVMVGVWKACEDEVLRITDLFNKRIAQCYTDTGITLEYTPGDVESAFKRHGI
ncbi:hypothetical protein PLEOSDRAFT_1036431 [Pleurotus ostreatus PC15]|uniref:Exocyst complex component Sec3 PIP2-binding N-terminal domain-containing protein n=1 Tax=Pleurotus ostreatus (strain PC15) TaxID=1137138 RepID=A0A067NSB4_PLEO1|nr:hypothetical protein PLEOSDRAFT_1036431 [Pleurotus ostreatus PC15]